jgi:AraC-like DNA-binding protein
MSADRSEHEPNVVRIDVGKVEPVRRKDLLAGTLRQYYYPLDVDVPQSFNGAFLKTFDVGTTRVGALSADAMIVRREPRHVRQDHEDYFLLPLPRHDRLVLDQAGRKASTGPSTVAFVGTSEPYSYEQPTYNAVQTLRIPATALRHRVPIADEYTATTFEPATNSMTPLVVAFARAFCEGGAQLTGSLTSKSEEHLLDLLALLLSNADHRTDETATRLAHRQRAIHVIEARFRDPGFKASDVAAAVCLSDRYLQKLFAERGETVSGTLRARRLAEARKLLGNRHVSRASVASIAYSAGFGDPAYFSRAFRQETGVAPGAYGD